MRFSSCFTQTDKSRRFRALVTGSKRALKGVIPITSVSNSTRTNRSLFSKRFHSYRLISFTVSVVFIFLFYLTKRNETKRRSEWERCSFHRSTGNIILYYCTVLLYHSNLVFNRAKYRMGNCSFRRSAWNIVILCCCTILLYYLNFLSTELNIKWQLFCSPDSKYRYFTPLHCFTLLFEFLFNYRMETNRSSLS